MPNYRNDLTDREIDHTHKLIEDVNGGHYETEIVHYKGTYYGDSITMTKLPGTNEYSHYWEGRCPQCERGGHPKNVICENCKCGETAVNPQGLKKFKAICPHENCDLEFNEKTLQLHLSTENLLNH